MTKIVQATKTQPRSIARSKAGEFPAPKMPSQAPKQRITKSEVPWEQEASHAARGAKVASAPEVPSEQSECPKGLKMPKSLAACADLLYQVKQERLAADKVATEIKKKESYLIEYIINMLPMSDARGITGKVANATIAQKAIPVVEDWDKFYAYVLKTKAFDLMQRRLNEAAVKERWEDKKIIPGVGTFNKKTVSLTKV